MPILNYTTSINAEKTVSEIQRLLAKRKAKAILTEYDDDGVLSHLSFRLATAHGIVSFRMPANINGVHKALCSDKKITAKKYRTREHASRVAWRICKDWIEAQVAIVDAEMADMLEIFLPYAQMETGETVYEVFEKKNFKMLTHQKS